MSETYFLKDDGTHLSRDITRCNPIGEDRQEVNDCCKQCFRKIKKGEIYFSCSDFRTVCSDYEINNNKKNKSEEK